jgi:hypothetical protein
MLFRENSKFVYTKKSLKISKIITCNYSTTQKISNKSYFISTVSYFCVSHIITIRIDTSVYLRIQEHFLNCDFKNLKAFTENIQFVS